jgi:hypothetical protein
MNDSLDLHLRYGQVLFNLSALRRERGDLRGAVDLLSRAVAEHLAARSRSDLAYSYLLLTQVHLAAGSIPDARQAAANLSAVLPELPEADRNTLSGVLERLRNRLEP